MASKADIVDHIANSVDGLTKKAAGEAFDAAIEAISKALKKGDRVQVPGFGSFGDVEWLVTWFKRCVMLGRPLAFGDNLGWAWLVAFSFLGFYLLLALIFPRGVERCAERWAGGRGGGAHRAGWRMRPLVGTPVPAVTTTFSTPSTWFTEVPRIWRTPSAMPFMPWM